MTLDQATVIRNAQLSKLARWAAVKSSIEQRFHQQVASGTPVSYMLKRRLSIASQGWLNAVQSLMDANNEVRFAD